MSLGLGSLDINSDSDGAVYDGPDPLNLGKHGANEPGSDAPTDSSQGNSGGYSMKYAGEGETTTETASRYQSGLKDLGGAVVGAGEGTFNLVTGKESATTVAHGAGKSLVNAATGGNAEQWRKEFWKQERKDGNDLSKAREQMKKELQRGNDGGGDIGIRVPGTKHTLRFSGGTVSTLSSANTAARVGFDALADSPTPEGGKNLQDYGTDAVTTVTGSDSKQEFADKAKNAQDAVNQFNKGLGQGYQNTIESMGLGDNAAVSYADEAVGTGFEWFVADPFEGAATLTTGVDSETGDTEARAEPADIADAMLIGAGNAVKAAAKAGKAAKATGKAATKAASGTDEAAKAATRADRTPFGVPDETTKTADDAAQSGEEGASTATAAAGFGALATALAKPSKMGKYTSFITDFSTKSDEALKTGASGVDEVASGVDDVDVGNVGRTDFGSLDTVDSFDTLSRSTDVSEDSLRFAEDVSDTSSAMDEGVQAGAAEGAFTSIDDLKLGRFGDESSKSADDITSGGAFDEAASSPSVSEDIGRFLSNITESGRRATETIRSGGDDFFTATDDVGSGSSRIVDDSAETSAKTGDETVFGVGDDAARASDDGGSAFDDMASGSDETASSLTGRVRKWFDELPARYKFGIPAIGGGLFLAGELGAFSVESPPGGMSGDPDKKPKGYNVEKVKTYRHGGKPRAVLFEVLRGSKKQGWKSMGHAIVVGKDKTGFLGHKGEWVVISESGRPTLATAIAGSVGQDNWVPEPRFGSEGEADTAFQKFIDWAINKAKDKTDPAKPTARQNPNVDGRLKAPDKVKQGESFSAAWDATLTSGKMSMSARLTLAIPTSGGWVPLAESDMTLGGGQKSDSGNFNVPGGWGSVSPGEHPLVAIVQKDGGKAGALAKTTVEVVPADKGSKAKEGSAWGDPQLARELPMGWFLYAQTKNDGSGETRFLVVGVRKDGTHIYLHSDGHARTEAAFFPTVKKAAAALKKWAKRVKGGSAKEGEIPSGRRPDPAKVKKHAAAADERGASGLISRLRQAAKKNPILFAGGTAATLAVGYYLYKEGYFGGALKEVSI